MKNKVLLIIGIIILLVGVGFILYPIITRETHSSESDDLYNQTMAIIENNLDQSNGSDSSNTAVNETPGTTDPVPTGDVYDNQGSEDLSGISFENINLIDGDDPDDTATVDKSRLSGQKCLGIITCEKIDLVYAIVEGVEDYNIGVAIGHFPDSVGIGQEGNCSLAGHNGGTYGRYFGDIKKLTEGDEVKMTDLNGYEYTYNVIECFVVDPQDVYVVGDLGREGKYLTMVTCTQHGTKRLIVRAKCTTDPVRMKGNH